MVISTAIDDLRLRDDGVCVTTLPSGFRGPGGAIDKPDQFRRIHKGAIPRLGGLGLAMGIAAGVLLPHISGWWDRINLDLPDLGYEWSILVAALIVLAVGFVDDTRSLGPRVKLLGQATAVMALYLGGVRIERIDRPGLTMDLSRPPAVDFAVLGFPIDLAPASLAVTMFWFLGCMNVWNLIDGMDGLASGVGLLVSGTLTLVAIHKRQRRGRDPGGRVGRQPGRVPALQLASRLHLFGRQRRR